MGDLVGDGQSVGAVVFVGAVVRVGALVVAVLGGVVATTSTSVDDGAAVFVPVALERVGVAVNGSVTSNARVGVGTSVAPCFFC